MNYYSDEDSRDDNNLTDSLDIEREEDIQNYKEIHH